MIPRQGKKEAMLYRLLEDKAVECSLCAHRCRIGPGKRGICGVRENRKGILSTLVYGKAVSGNLDPIEKKPLFHFLPGTLSYSVATAGCNFRCDFCQNWEISQAGEMGGDTVPGHILPPQTIVKEALSCKCQSISYTYTEPTIFFEYAYDTAKLAREEGLKNVFVTNGYQTPETVDKMKGLIDAANVDLKSFSEEFYSKFCKAHLKPVLETIKNMYKAGIMLEVTTLLVPGENDSSEELKKIAGFLAATSVDIPWHLSRFYPHYRMPGAPPTPPETIHRAIETGKAAGLRYLYAGNLPGSDYENSFCPHCNKIVVARVGYTVGDINLRGTICAYCGKELAFYTG